MENSERSNESGVYIRREMLFMQMEENIYAHNIRGVKYIVHSVYGGEPLPVRFGALIQNSFDSSTEREITGDSSVDCDMDIAED